MFIIGTYAHTWAGVATWRMADNIRQQGGPKEDESGESVVTSNLEPPPVPGNETIASGPKPV